MISSPLINPKLFFNFEKNENLSDSKSFVSKMRNLKEFPKVKVEIPRKTQIIPSSQSSKKKLRSKKKGNKTPTYVGEEAMTSFYSKYKDLRRENEKATESSSSVSYLNEIQKNGKTPTSLGFLTRRGRENKIKIK